MLGGHAGVQVAEGAQTLFLQTWPEGQSLSAWHEVFVSVGGALSWMVVSGVTGESGRTFSWGGASGGTLFSSFFFSGDEVDTH